MCGRLVADEQREVRSYRHALGLAMGIAVETTAAEHGAYGAQLDQGASGPTISREVPLRGWRTMAVPGKRF